MKSAEIVGCGSARWEPTPECDACDHDIPTGEVVVLEGALLCIGCGWTRATETLGALLDPSYTPAAPDLRRFADAHAVMQALAARIAARLGGRV